MVSRRNFVSICIMMAVILFMFQFLLVIRDVQNDFDSNEHLSETLPTQNDVWDPDGAEGEVETVAYVVSGDTPLSEIIEQWGGYTKRKIVKYSSLTDFKHSNDDEPILLCIRGSEIRTKNDVSILSSLADDGLSIVFCDLPSVDIMRRLPELSTLLGIQQISADEIELVGIKLFSGFLLGGEVIYQASNEKEQKMQDMELSVPWYLTASGTKSYMVGLLDDPEIENEDLPAIIWRNSYGNAYVFAINGTYMYDQTALGILDAVIYELRDYEIHPVVNAQNLSLANYPEFASENTEELMRIYARNLRRLQMDLMWPNLIASTSKSNYKMTCFLTPQMDYTTTEEILTDDLTFYLKQFKEQSAEAGLSMEYMEGIDLDGKLKSDQAFFDNTGSEYSYGSAYISAEDKDKLAELSSYYGLLKDLRTVTSVGESTDAILSYCTDTVVDQGVTANGFDHTYLQDLRIRSIETALGYSNILLDMKRISWPDDGAEYWEVLYESFSSNINTYWNAFSAFEKTTLSESDERVRAFLTMDYSSSRSEDRITVAISDRIGDVWFLLRTHSEVIDDIEGGEYQKIEEGVYLICAHEDVVTIDVEPDKSLIYKLP